VLAAGGGLGRNSSPGASQRKERAVVLHGDRRAINMGETGVGESNETAVIASSCATNRATTINSPQLTEVVKGSTDGLPPSNFLLAVNGDVEKAKEMYATTMKWREENKVDQVLQVNKRGRLWWCFCMLPVTCTEEMGTPFWCCQYSCLSPVSKPSRLFCPGPTMAATRMATSASIIKWDDSGWTS